MADSLAQRIAELAAQLIRIPSGNPPGDEDPIAQFAADWLRDAGLAPRSVPLEPGRSSVVARLPGCERGSIVLCGHLDTVGTDPTAWRVPPYEGRIEDGRLWGLGAADMKGSVAVLMHVMARLGQSETPTRRDVVLALTADEELGYRGAATIAESGLIDDAALLLIAEPTAGHVYVGQKGELWVEGIFAGREAHGSTPERGVNSILPAARFCDRLQGEMSTMPDVPGVGRTTLNIGQFRGGRRVNIVPDRTVVQLDIRVVRPEDHDTALAIVDRIGGEESETSGVRFERRVISYHPPIVGDPSGSEAQALQQAVRDVTGVEPPIGVSPFSTDAVSIVPRLAVPVLMIGPGDIGRAHQPDESVAISTLHDAYKVLWRFLAPENRETS